MSRVVIAGEAAVFASSAKLGDLRKVQKYNPSSLILTDEDGNEYFRVGVGNKGEIGKYGIVFNTETNDGSGDACITVDLSGADFEDIKSYIAENYGGILANLDKVEAGISEIVGTIDANIAAIKDSITILA